MFTPLTPGTYLRLRRQSADLSIEDVAALVQTEPRWSEIDRVAWLLRIEADVAAISPDVAKSLKSTFRFSWKILGQLIDHRSYGRDAGEPPRVCNICGCSAHDACFDGHATCAWSGDLNLCTACAPAPSLILDPEA